MRAVTATLAASVLALAGATELDKDSWDAAVAGKSVFIKFQAPWCGHCKRMKPDWDKLMEANKGNANVLVADVDCTAGGKSLCEQIGVRGYPTIKHGDPNDLQEYKGGRELSALKEFAENLGPVCGPTNIDLCDADKKKQIEEIQKMTPEAREEQIKAKSDELEKVEADFKEFVEGLQAQYEKSNKEKDAKIEEVKSSGLGLLKAVHASAAAAKKEGKPEL